MKIRFYLFLQVFLVSFAMMAQEKTITGTVTDQDGLPLPGANVVVKGTANGTQTDFDGNYTIVASEGEILLFSYIGMTPQEKTVGAAQSISVQLMYAAEELEGVVVTALGIKREEKTLAYSSQPVSSEQLNITETTDVKGALAGKVAGVQINGQAGSKLGQSGKIRIRGGISLTGDGDPLYVIDGIPTTDPNAVDMSNVETINVLKGPNATALYGQRADAGVVQITTKRGKQTDRIGVEVTSSLSFDKVGNMMKYQNLYGQGYGGDAEFGTFDFDGGYNFAVFGISGGPYPEYMRVFDGQRYFNGNVYADESWGPAFDGQPYVPWYAYYPDSPYFGQTDTWEAHPDNIRDFYNTGTTFKNIVTLSGGGENFTARLSYTNLNQEGIIPESKLTKNFINTSFDFDLNDNFTVGVTANYSEGTINGDFDDGYSNQTTGSFNSWFGRNIDVNKLRELKGLTTPEGYLASWNNWGLDAMAAGEDIGEEGFKKAAFWFNPFDWLDQYKNEQKTTSLIGNIHATYKFLDHFEATVMVSRNDERYKRYWEVPYMIQYSAAPSLYNEWVNSFGRRYDVDTEDNYNGFVKYDNDFGNFDVSAMFGGTIRKNNYYRFINDMDSGNSDSGGLILPDVFVYSNSRELLTAQTYEYKKQVNSLYGNISLGYMDMLYLDASLRKDWSSALPSDNNGYTYPSIGGSFIFSELIDSDILSFGKLRGGWAQVGNDVGALALNQVYPLGDDLYNGKVLQYDRSQLIDPNISPALNSSYEIGLDLKFFQNRIGLNATYYNETREGEIIPITISTGTGYADYLTNAGESNRKGIELALDVDIFRNPDGFNWNLVANWSTNKSEVISLPGDLNSIDGLSSGGADDWAFVNFVHRPGEEWGQLRGRGIAKDDAGNPIVRADGSYDYVDDQYFGSVLPDFTGGFVNTFRYKNWSLMAALDYQKGGKFFSLSEMWGGYSGLTAETATINNNGNNIRDAVADGGGVNVVGVSPDGTPVDTYVEAVDYFGQFQSNSIAEPFIHNADYIKLRDVSLTYTLPGSMVNDFFQSASISFIARNLWLISVADDNVHNWDPSEMSQVYGENAQLPSTRSFGMNLKLTF
ncbi:SusC/RagA family TonB-linked outer membrane protein [Robertkochia solimangrovi]|uniref:SusC/RagA family TonB-linked outer membrane protein n=1 Tax=Robertkochia solimangrovi TaxID=2213046 RepID=UPI00117E2CA1|nr:SusC/RagA family TonB-linked outer membrane protein [Robertkochia solimangrovi]TRZ44281.1 hypothetical protein DMZ48_07130 [Robertkochia solimangrovi]